MTGTIWPEFLAIIKDEVGSRVVETWFKAVSLVEWDAITATVYLAAPNEFVIDWIKNHYASVIEVHLKRLLYVDHLKIIFTSQQASSAEPSSPAATYIPSVSLGKQASKEKMVPTRLGSQKNYAGRSYTFDSFVIGPNNSLAYAAAKAISDKPGTIYNPLFIYGDSGLGKTHLLHAIANEIRRLHPGYTILYQPADRFVTEFINAIRFDKIHIFQQKYKAVDVLLIDDIQCISKKEQTQEAFFHIFNTLYDSQKQIVFSSDTYPQNMSGLAERLRYRLAWGLVADMHIPTLETKIAILKKKAELLNENISDDVAQFIAAHITANVRELEGSLIRVIAFASLTNQPISLELAEKVLKRINETKKTSVGFDRVVKCISKYYPYTLEDLRSSNRSKELAFVRQLAMFLMKKVTDKSLRDIGFYLGGRDHSTVMHAVDKVQIQATTNAEFGNKLKRLEEEIVNTHL